MDTPTPAGPTRTPEYEAYLDASRRRRALALELRRAQPKKTYQEIGDALGVTRERARQMINQAMAEESSQ